MESGLWEMTCEMWGVGVWVMGWWEMLRETCEKSSTQYKTNIFLCLVVKYPCFIAKMYILAYSKTKKAPKKSP